MAESWVDRLAKLFRQNDAVNAAVATSGDIERFESKYGVKIPADWQNYFLRLNGTQAGWAGADGPMEYGFWHLDQIKTMSEEEEIPDWPEPQHWFYFADYLIWSFCLAVKWTDSVTAAPEILVELRETRRVIAHDMATIVAAFEREDFHFLAGE